MDKMQKPLFEAIWETREEEVYPKLFGDRYRGTFVLTQDVFMRTFRQSDIDPRWLRYGVIEFEPTPQRNSWIYVTSGTSNPWDAEPSEYESCEYSGFGTELVLETPEQSQWAILILQRLLAFNILLVHGRFGLTQPLDYGSRVPLRCSIDLDGGSALTHVVFGAPEHYSHSFKLLSGKVDFLHMVGITQSERDYAQAQDSAQLLDKLKAAKAFPVTKPARIAVV